MKKLLVLVIVGILLSIAGCAANPVFCKRCGMNDSEAPVQNPLPMCPECPDERSRDKK